MLSGKFALVTGSTSGIGLAIAHALAAQGCGIVIEGLAKPPELAALKEEFSKKYNVPVLVSDADLSKESDIVGLVEQSLSAFGRIDILVNNAGMQFVAPLADFPIEKWDQIIAINLTSAFLLTKMLVPAMQKNQWGRIVNIASAHGLVASAQKSAYVASKHGLIGLTKVTALDYANEGITANAVCPGWVRTPLVEKQLDDKAKTDGITVEEEAKKFLAAKQPLLQFTHAEDLAAMVVFLCSDAGRTITGTSLSMDGGWTAQ